MIAKIVQGHGFRGVINYVLDKDHSHLIYSEGVRLKDKESIIQSFVVQQKLNPKIVKPVAHISLDFSVQDKNRLTDQFMAGMALEYMEKMGYRDTQYIIARHHDTDHPHIHIVINRIDNNGKRISDQNEKLRNTWVCMELTKKYGLYIASGKENVKEHRLKEPDKTKYEIYHALKSAIPNAKNWKELKSELLQSGITIEFRKNGNTDKIQGVRFGKNGYEFNGSKIDRSCSYSKISYQLYLNEKLHQSEGQHHSATNQSDQLNRQDNTMDFSSGLENAASVLGGLFDFMNPSHHYDENEADFLKEQARRRKKKKDNQYRHRL
ncbi:mobilization protein BmgA [Aquipluma nitroreducens]|uniref:Mobilization protein BmgA n=1 Tax=Aquipluma nitroreducens TaxID=2010828 RepID=A0A5K7S8M0_9BACT|nr:relaxase/mobilization nuclease domain-containing protein [Aquipluma nitroreducens]BBE17809.1 mobilization protein BmgA [Aquipluma nitroreducens]